MVVTHVADADVLAHFQACDFCEPPSGHLAEVHAENAPLVLRDAVLAEAVGAELGLVTTEGNAGHIAAIVLAGEGAEGAPAAADVEETGQGLNVPATGYRVDSLPRTCRRA
jgi:hypothetical protein